MTDEKKNQGFTNLPNEVIELKISPLEKIVLIVLIRYYNREKGYSYPSYPILMEMCCASKNSVIKGLNELEKREFIKKEILNGKGNRYYINFSKFEGVTSSKTEPVQNLNPFKNCTRSENEPHPFKNCTPPVQNLNPTNTNINTNTITNNNMSDSKESDHSPGAFKGDNNNSNKTTKSSKTKRATKVFEENSIEYQLSKKLYQYVLEEKPKTRKPDLQKWSKDFDLILRRDERSLEDLENVIDWIFNGDSNNSNFWKKNISSPGALRGTTKNGADKFAEIYSQMENDTNYYRPLQKELEKELPPITAEEFYDI